MWFTCGNSNIPSNIRTMCILSRRGWTFLRETSTRSLRLVRHLRPLPFPTLPLLIHSPLSSPALPSLPLPPPPPTVLPYKRTIDFSWCYAADPGHVFPDLSLLAPCCSTSDSLFSRFCVSFVAFQRKMAPIGF